jgi:hypothetical protein
MSAATVLSFDGDPIALFYAPAFLLHGGLQSIILGLFQFGPLFSSAFFKGLCYISCIEFLSVWFIMCMISC